MAASRIPIARPSKIRRFFTSTRSLSRRHRRERRYRRPRRRLAEGRQIPHDLLAVRLAQHEHIRPPRLRHTRIPPFRVALRPTQLQREVLPLVFVRISTVYLHPGSGSQAEQSARLASLSTT